jgi:hypothetical protein
LITKDFRIENSEFIKLKTKLDYTPTFLRDT